MEFFLVKNILPLQLSKSESELRFPLGFRFRFLMKPLDKWNSAHVLVDFLKISRLDETMFQIFSS